MGNVNPVNAFYEIVYNDVLNSIHNAINTYNARALEGDGRLIIKQNNDSREARVSDIESCVKNMKSIINAYIDKEAETYKELFYSRGCDVEVD